MLLDPNASADVIAQKLRQTGFVISKRSVERVIADYALGKSCLGRGFLETSNCESSFGIECGIGTSREETRSMGKRLELSVAQRREAVLCLLRREAPVGKLARRFGVSEQAL